MAIKVNGTTVINDSRALQNVASVDATTAASITAAGVGAGGTAPTSGTTYGVAFPFEPPNLSYFNFYSDTYMTSPSSTRTTAGDGFNLGMTGNTAGTVKIRANMRVVSGSNTIFFRVVKNGTQVSEQSTNSTFNTDKDIDVTFAVNDRIEIQFKVATYGQDARLNSIKVLSGTNARGCLIVGQ